MAAVASAALTLAGCTGAPTDGYAEPSHYSYRVQYSAFAPTAGTWDIEVSEGKVVAFEPVYSGAAERVENFGLTAADMWTLGEIVAAYESAAGTSGAEALISWNDETDQPAVVSIDWDVSTYDDEDYWIIESVTELPGP